MAFVKNPSLQTQIRLKKWPAGRVNQLKLFVGHLEQAIGRSLAAQVQQSPKRKFSEFVPKIVEQDITAEATYREIRFYFTPPKGLRDLLFYEYQISATAGFYNVDQFTSPENFYIWPGLTEGFTYYLRARVVTKNGDVGPWSDVQAVTTPYSQTYGLYDGTEYSGRVTYKAFYPAWWIVYQRDYTAIGGKCYYACDYDAVVARKWTLGLGEGNVEWCDLEFKWMEKGPSDTGYKQIGQIFGVTTYGTSTSFSNSGFYSFNVRTHGFYSSLNMPGTWTMPRRGTFVQKLHTLEQGDMKIRLEARILPDHDSDVFINDFYPTLDKPAGLGTKFRYGSDAIIKIRNFNIFEAVVDAG